LLFDDTLIRPYEWGPDELIKMALAYRIVQNLMKQSTGNLGRCIDSCSGMRIAHKKRWVRMYKPERASSYVWH
jgi:hypothetical protein